MLFKLSLKKNRVLGFSGLHGTWSWDPQPDERSFRVTPHKPDGDVPPIAEKDRKSEIMFHHLRSSRGTRSEKLEGVLKMGKVTDTNLAGAFMNQQLRTEIFQAYPIRTQRKTMWNIPQTKKTTAAFLMFFSCTEGLDKSGLSSRVL